MARQIYRIGGDIYDASSNQKLGYTDFMSNWAGKADVQDLGQRTVPQTTTPTVNPVTPTTPQTLSSDVYQNDYMTPEERLFLEKQGNDYKTKAEEVIDENAIRANTLAKFQAEIDSLNKVYAEKKATERIAGQGRLGSVAAIGARRGLLGSDFGVSQERNQSQANLEAENAIEAERAYKESMIQSKVREMASSEIEAKTLAKQQGAENYTKFIKESAARKEKNVSDVAKMLYDNDAFETTDLDTLASQLGVNKNQIKQAYNIYKLEADRKKKLEELEAEKFRREGMFNLSAGEKRYDAKGNLIAGTDKPIDPMDYVKIVDGNMLEYNPKDGTWSVIYEKQEKPSDNTKVVGGSLLEKDANGNWRVIYTPPKDAKSLTISEKLSLSEKGYTVDESGNLVKSENKQNTAANKVLADSIPGLLTHKGLNSAVGPNIMTRIAVGDAFGNKQDFIGRVQQLADALTLRKLIEVKGQGATFGALSDSERAVIERAATPINQWAIKDKNGKIKGYDISQALFKKELEKLQNEYTSKSTKTLEDYQSEFPEATPMELKALMEEEGQTSFNNVGGDTNKAIVNQLMSKADNVKGGQCGRFVNQITGLGVGDSYQSKMSKMDKSIKQPAPGMVFTMPYKNTGHIGFILAVNNDGTVTVKDSNYGLDEKIRTHRIPISSITGLARV